MEDAAYFIKFAVGSYGWALYMFMNPCAGPLNLCGGLRYGTARLHVTKISCCQIYAFSRQGIEQSGSCLGSISFASMKVARVHAYSFKRKLILGSQPFMVALLSSVVLNMLGNLKQSKEALNEVEAQEQFQAVTLTQKSKSYLTKNKQRKCAIL